MKAAAQLAKVVQVLGKTAPSRYYAITFYKYLPKTVLKVSRLAEGKWCNLDLKQTNRLIWKEKYKTAYRKYETRNIAKF